MEAALHQQGKRLAIGIAESTRVSTPSFSSEFCNASAFITVASMPM